MFEIHRDGGKYAYDSDLDVKIFQAFSGREPGRVFIHKYENKSKNVFFDFYVQEFSQSITYKDNAGDNHTGFSAISNRIIESGYSYFDLRKTICSAIFDGKLDNISDPDYEYYKSILISGIFCLSTFGGYHLRFVPDFYVDCGKIK